MKSEVRTQKSEYRSRTRSRVRVGSKVRRSAYVLILRDPRQRAIVVGGLGRTEFRPGFYVYVGSGGTNALRRVQRHLAPKKRVRWHIDYLTTGRTRFRPVDAYFIPGRSECRVAEMLARRLEPVPGFGASDCQCRTHLFCCPDVSALATALGGLRCAGRPSIIP